MTKDTPSYTVKYDLTNCDAEPLHRILLFQAHALLMVCKRDNYQIVAASDSLLHVLNSTKEEVLGSSITKWLDPDTIEILRTTPKEELQAFNPIYQRNWQHRSNKSHQNLLAYWQADHLILEFEARQQGVSEMRYLAQVDQSIQQLQRMGGSSDIFQQTCKTLRSLTGFDRVMIYRFDEQYNGHVIAEEKIPELESYLDLHYPHTDIPKQARELYLRNQIRHIVNTQSAEANYIHRLSEEVLLDLSLSANRGVSAIHLEYLNNMGVGSSLSAAIIVDGQLWGLIACHYGQAKLLDYRQRSMIGFFARIISGQLALRETNAFREKLLQTNLTRSRLFEQMNNKYDIVAGLVQDKQALLQLTGAASCVLFFNKQLIRVGETPNTEELQELLTFLQNQSNSLYTTHALGEALPTAASWTVPVAGVLSIRISASAGEYIIWMRPEEVQTVKWGGSPEQRKIVEEGKVRLHPELSFKQWVEMREGQSLPWQQHQRDAAFSLRNDIKDIILQKFQEITELNKELTTAYEEMESFSYTVSHDLRAPLRAIKGFAEILEEDYEKKLDDYGKTVIKTILSSVGKMNQFINDILNFSRLGRTGLIINELNLQGLIEEVWNNQSANTLHQVKLSILTKLPVIQGDSTHIKQLIDNLFSNAIKYSRLKADPLVKVWAEEHEHGQVLHIRDNGIGFDMQYADSVFTVFHRLTSSEEYEGTGIGMAIAKKIVEKHLGEIWVESEPGNGTTFSVLFRNDLSELIKQS